MTASLEDKDFVLGNRPEGLNVEASKGPPTSIQVSNVLSLRQDVDKLGLAGKIWQSAYALQSYFSQDTGLTLDPPSPIPTHFYYNDKESSNDEENISDHKPYKILELGAGTGYLGIALANMLGVDCQVYITDLEPVVPLIKENVQAHHLPNRAQIFCERLHWGDRENTLQLLNKVGGRFDLIVISDCVYFPELFQPLMDTLLWICNDPSTKVVIGYKCRSLEKETGFWDLHFGRYFDYEPARITADIHHKENEEDEESKVGKLLGYEEQLYVFIGSRRDSHVVKAADDRFALMMFCAMDY